jgi:hypothetical protein
MFQSGELCERFQMGRFARSTAPCATNRSEYAPRKLLLQFMSSIAVSMEHLASCHLPIVRQ